MIYLKSFDGLNKAKQATLISPTVIVITEQERTEAFMQDKGLNVEMVIPASVTSLDDVVIVKKSNTFKLSESKLNSGATYA